MHHSGCLSSREVVFNKLCLLINAVKLSPRLLRENCSVILLPSFSVRSCIQCFCCLSGNFLVENSKVKGRYLKNQIDGRMDIMDIMSWTCLQPPLVVFLGCPRLGIMALESMNP